MLTARLDAAADRTTRRPKTGLFRLAVDRSFTLAGLGTAVTGTVLSGSVHVEDRVLVSPSGLEARVRSINAQNRPVDRGEAGQRCALVLSGPHINKDAVRRGDVVLDSALHAPTARIDARLRVLPSEPKPIGQWFPVKVHHAAAEVPGRVVVLRNEPIEPGETDTCNWYWNGRCRGGRRPLRSSRHVFEPHRRGRRAHRLASARASPHARLTDVQRSRPWRTPTRSWR